MKDVIVLMFILLYMAGIVSAVLSTVAGIVYLLYLWGSVGLPLGAAVWGGFVLWSQMLFGGLLATLVGFVVTDVAQ